MRTAYVIATILLVVSPLAGAEASRPGGRAHQRIVPAHGPGMKANGPESYFSPDGKYVAIKSHGEADTGHLAIGKVRKGRAPEILVRDIGDLEGFMWVPQHTHMLVAAACSIYSEHPGVFLWNGGTRLRRLRSRRTRWQECYFLQGATADGRVLLYSHALDTPSYTQRRWEAQRNRIRWLMLPRN